LGNCLAFSDQFTGVDRSFYFGLLAINKKQLFQVRQISRSGNYMAGANIAGFLKAALAMRRE
jgi:hypothetical protein